MKIAIHEDSDIFHKLQILKKMGFRTPTDVVNEAIRILFRQKIDEACALAAKMQSDGSGEGPDMMQMQGLKID